MPRKPFLEAALFEIITKVQRLRSSWRCRCRAWHPASRTPPTSSGWVPGICDRAAALASDSSIHSGAECGCFSVTREGPQCVCGDLPGASCESAQFGLQASTAVAVTGEGGEVRAPGTVCHPGIAQLLETVCHPCPASPVRVKGILSTSSKERDRKADPHRSHSATFDFPDTLKRWSGVRAALHGHRRRAHSPGRASRAPRCDGRAGRCAQANTAETITRRCRSLAGRDPCAWRSLAHTCRGPGGKTLRTPRGSWIPLRLSPAGAAWGVAGCARRGAAGGTSPLSLPCCSVPPVLKC